MLFDSDLRFIARPKYSIAFRLFTPPFDLVHSRIGSTTISVGARRTTALAVSAKQRENEEEGWWAYESRDYFAKRRACAARFDCDVECAPSIR
ncbi:MAG: hypothetical protein EAZ21_11900 [Betaproteobacteria bacterium]|nr:MAG: hypothetical protein EAZ21_11900 [Betaproteobacteria bacterium]